MVIATAFILPILNSPVGAKSLPSTIHVNQNPGINTVMLTFNIKAPKTTDWNEKDCKHFFSLSTRNEKLITSAKTKFGDNLTEEFDTPIGDGHYISTNILSVTVERNGHQEKGIMRIVGTGPSPKGGVTADIAQWVFISDKNKGLPTCQGSAVGVAWPKEKDNS